MSDSNKIESATAETAKPVQKNKRRYTKTTPEIRQQIDADLKNNVPWKDIADKLKVSAPVIFKQKRALGLTRPYSRKLAKGTPEKRAASTSES